MVRMLYKVTVHLHGSEVRMSSVLDVNHGDRFVQFDMSDGSYKLFDVNAVRRIDVDPQ